MSKSPERTSTTEGSGCFDLHNLEEIDGSGPERERVLIDIVNILHEQYAANRTITFDQLTEELFERTGADWTNPKTELFRALNELNRIAKQTMLSACVVNKHKIPADGFFRQAIQLGRLKENPSTEEMLVFWLEQFRKQVRRFSVEITPAPAGVSESEGAWPNAERSGDLLATGGKGKNGKIPFLPECE